MSDEPGLFEVPDDAYVLPPPKEELTRGQQRKRLVLTRISRGEHPLGRIRLHTDAASGREGDGLRCGTCRFRELVGGNQRSYPKCRLPLVVGGRETYPRDTGCESSDIAAWWPACADYRAEVEKSAVISDCGRYRYELRRVWDPTGPLLEFIMLNPSTADASVDDPTIRRCIAFAMAWGYGGIVVRNLFAFRATNPGALLAIWEGSLSGGDYHGGADDLGPAIGPENFDYLARMDADCTIAAWGAHAATLEWWAAGHRIERRNLFCLGTNANGSPKHPLYVRADCTPIRWEKP